MNATLTSLAALSEAGLISRDGMQPLHEVAARYAIAVPPAMAQLITAGESAIARQFLPDAREAHALPEDLSDPIGDDAHSPVKGLVHRYKDRALLKLTHSCPVYCRFCFRRETVGPGGDGLMDEAALDAAFAYLAAHPEIIEVILTGGDPLALSPRRIGALTKRLAGLAHLRMIRWHSRVPVVAPERITPALLDALDAPGRTVFVMVHANVAQEFTAEAEAALARLTGRNIVLLGQSVLLKSVNDSVEALHALFTRMAINRIRPVYLHHPDLASGTAHFRLSIREGQALYGALRGQLSGHAIPAYVLDLPGGHGKVPIGPEHIRESAGGIEIRDIKGKWHAYP